MPSSLLLLVVLSSSLTAVSAYCFAGTATLKITPLGTPVAYCEYKGLELLPGSHIKTTNCEECTCTENGLRCCGFGSSGGVFAPAPGCKMISDACIPKMVKIDDPEKDCMTGQSVVSAVGRR